MKNDMRMANAKTWSEEAVWDSLRKIEETAHDTTALYLGSALVSMRISRKAWSYWKNRFADDEDMMEQMELIEEIFEQKLFEGAMRSTVPASVAIFALKNNHQWTDRAQAEPMVLQALRPPMLVELDEYTVMSIP